MERRGEGRRGVEWRVQEKRGQERRVEERRGELHCVNGSSNVTVGEYPPVRLACSGSQGRDQAQTGTASSDRPGTALLREHIFACDDGDLFSFE